LQRSTHSVNGMLPCPTSKRAEQSSSKNTNKTTQ